MDGGAGSSGSLAALKPRVVVSSVVYISKPLPIYLFVGGFQLFGSRKRKKRYTKIMFQDPLKRRVPFRVFEISLCEHLKPTCEQFLNP